MLCASFAFPFYYFGDNTGTIHLYLNKAEATLYGNTTEMSWSDMDSISNVRAMFKAVFAFTILSTFSAALLLLGLVLKLTNMKESDASTALCAISGKALPYLFIPIVIAIFLVRIAFKKDVKATSGETCYDGPCGSINGDTWGVEVGWTLASCAILPAIFASVMSSPTAQKSSKEEKHPLVGELN